MSETYLSENITFQETEINNIFEITSIKYGHIGTIVLNDTINKYVFTPKEHMFYKAFQLAKILTKINELNNSLKNKEV